MGCKGKKLFLRNNILISPKLFSERIYNLQREIQAEYKANRRISSILIL